MLATAAWACRRGRPTRNFRATCHVGKIMGGKRSSLMLAGAAVCCGLLAPAAAGASSTPIATLSAETPISAGQGWLVWSARSASGWALEGFFEGRVGQLAVGP